MKQDFIERVSRELAEDFHALGYREVKPELALEARDFLLQPSIVSATFAYWARRCA